MTGKQKATEIEKNVLKNGLLGWQSGSNGSTSAQQA
jgi:hypothetical protein